MPDGPVYWAARPSAAAVLEQAHWAMANDPKNELVEVVVVVVVAAVAVAVWWYLAPTEAPVAPTARWRIPSVPGNWAKHHRIPN